MAHIDVASSGLDGLDGERVFDARPLQSQNAQKLLEYHVANSIPVPTPAAAPKLLLSLYAHVLTQGYELRAAGILEVLPDGFGFLRHPHRDFVANIADLYLSPSQITRFGLRTGDLVYGSVRKARGNESNMAMLKIHELENRDVNTLGPRLEFDDLEVVGAQRPLRLDAHAGDLAHACRRLGDLQLGERVLVSGPPSAGASTWLPRLAEAIASRRDLTCIGLLADVRPDEAQRFKRIRQAWCAAADSASPSEQQCRAIRLGLERARRLVEGGEDVVVLLDSLGSYARALTACSQRNAIQARNAAKNLFASARETSAEGASLTIIANMRRDEDDAGMFRELSRSADRVYELSDEDFGAARA